MTVKELRDYLGNLPQDARVVTEANHKVGYNTWDFRHCQEDGTVCIGRSPLAE